MRAIFLFMFAVGAPIYFGAAFSGYGFNLGGLLDLRDIRQELTASDFVHDRMSQARDYAMAHPGLVEGVKAHRPELQDLRSRLCSMVQC